MAGAFDWFKTTLENLIKPFMENKKAVLILLGLLVGTGAYTVIDQTGNGLKAVPEEVTEEPVLSNDDSPKVPEVEVQEVVVPIMPQQPAPVVKHETKIVRETIQPIIHCPPSRADQVMDNHVKEFH